MASRQRARATARAVRPPAPPPLQPLPPRGYDARALAAAVLVSLLVLATLVVSLSHAAQRRSGTNGVLAEVPLHLVHANDRICQGQELVPAGTAAIQLPLLVGQTQQADIAVTLRRGGHLLARGAVPTVEAGQGVQVAIRPPARDLAGVEVCFDSAAEGMTVVGGETPPHVGAVRINRRVIHRSVPLVYMRAGQESWWARAGTVTRHMGMGRGRWGGGWVPWGVLVLVLASLALGLRAMTQALIVERAPPPEQPRDEADAPTTGMLSRARALLDRAPPLALTIAGIAVLNAVAWSLLTPMFQVPDEQTHFAYAQQIGERGRPPVARAHEVAAPELRVVLEDVRFGELSADGRTYGAAVWSPLDQRRLEHDLRIHRSRHGNDDAGPADPEPPLYYVLEAIPYRLASGATLLDRLALMRLLSALMAGVTALLVFLFVRESLPGQPWAWAVGGLGAAYVPLLGFISGAVNPDALLFAIAAALFYGLARAFRRGLTTRGAIWLGVVLALGAIGKINFYGMVPGALAALALAAHASAGGWNRRAARLVGIAVGIAVIPYALMTLLDATVWQRGLILAHTPAEEPTSHGNLGGQFSYLWQLFLPRLPGQTVAFPGFYPGYQLWLNGFVGRFGWLAVRFPPWGYSAAAVSLGLVAALAVRAVVGERGELRRRRAELAGYVLIVASLMFLLSMVALRGWAPGITAAIQGRYLLPLLPLFGAVLALGARGAGRWGRAAGAAIVVAAIAWSLFAQLLTVGFFYG